MEIHNNQKCVKDYQDVDRISNLPDGIRSHILSLIPTKSALKMSILSKQWKHLWTQVPVLDFTEMPPSCMNGSRHTSQHITGFKNFIHKVLVHNDVPCLQLLDLDLQFFHWDDISCINSWLDIIAKRDIHEIDIRYMCADQPQVALPTNFLSRERLVLLKLHGRFSIDDKMLLHLPNLEVIFFAGLQFPNDEFLKRMLPGCLVLKNLTIVYCTGINNSLFVESFSLRRLRILCARKETKHTCIVIRTPNLRYLHLRDTLKQRVIGDLSSLDSADLNLNYDSPDCALQVLQLVSTVTKLSLKTSEFLRHISKPPIFQNLTSLELDHAENLCTILGCASNLKCLSFAWAAYADKSLESEQVPVCLSRLEEVCFYRFLANEEEFELVAYFLKFASNLKEMYICIVSPTRKTVYERLLMLPRSSNSCQILSRG